MDWIEFLGANDVIIDFNVPPGVVYVIPRHGPPGEDATPEERESYFRGFGQITGLTAE